MVNLVWITPEAGKVISYCARVSNPKNQENYDTAPKLLKYLKDNRHWSPFEMASACFEIITTRDIARQILRHRSFSFQEFSQRYSEVAEEPIYREARLQDLTNRQNSIRTESCKLGVEWAIRQREVWETAVSNYREALDKGIAKEVARALLPEGLTPSKMYMSGTMRSWLHYLDVRIGNGTQWEHQEIALQIREVLRDQVPEIF